jgi:hypothetical protein
MAVTRCDGCRRYVSAGGAFRASDQEVVQLESEVIRKIFSKVTTPIPVYLTHRHAGTGMPRTVLGHVVKLGLEAEGDKLHFKAVMMDPDFKLMYASGYDDTSAEVNFTRDETNRIVDGTLTGIAVVPNPAIQGTEMKVSAIAFAGPQGQCPAEPASVNKFSGGIRLTGKKVENLLLENGIAADKVEPILETLESHFQKKFEQGGLQKKFEDQTRPLRSLPENSAMIAVISLSNSS